jgi:formate transporter
VVGHVPAGFDASLITIPGIVHNLVPVTLGNIVGGAGFVGFISWAIYRKGLGARSAEVRP